LPPFFIMAGDVSGRAMLAALAIAALMAPTFGFAPGRLSPTPMRAA
jgi:hypothetical protein